MLDTTIDVKTKYCMFLDGDTTSERDLDELMGEFAKKNFDLASVRVLASKKKTVIEHLQNIEYEIAMDAKAISLVNFWSLYDCEN